MALVVAASACAGGTSSEPAGRAGESGGARGEGPALIATVEEQGSFSTPCQHSHTAPDDPIVHPGHEDVSHQHDFFGATSTDGSSDASSLLAGGTNCRSAADHSAYWAPALLDGGRPVQPVEMLAYYRVPVGADATRVEAPPNGLEMIAGDASATEPQDPSVVGWVCGRSETVSPVPQRCTTGTELRLLLRFDPCWDGEHLSSSDHRSHLAALTDEGECPGSHPVMIPELTLEIRYRPASDGGADPAAAARADAGATAADDPAADTGSAGLALASGPVTGGHGDALLAWDEAHITREVDLCLRANRRCDVVSESARLGFDQVAG